MAADSKIADWQAIGVKDIAQNEKVRCLLRRLQQRV